MEYDKLFKLVIIGNSGVGKSCILLRFSDDMFREEELATIGVDFKIKTIRLDGEVIKLQIWDTAGQERFSTITSSYYKGSHGIIVVYDVTSRQSFDQIDNWMRAVNDFAPRNVPRVLVANKIDLVDSRKVSQSEGQSLATSLGMPYLEVSAKASQNIEELFVTLSKLANEIVGTETSGELAMKSVDLRESRTRSRSSKCCR